MCHTMEMSNDTFIPAGYGHGIDVAVQRADDLDMAAIAFARENSGMWALDLACGLGGQAWRLAETGIATVAADIMDPQDRWPIASVERPPLFVSADMRALPEHWGPFGLIVCQRAIHYLKYEEAVAVLRRLYGFLRADGRLFLSASGLDSELGDGYPDRDRPAQERFALLREDRQKQHGIEAPVCLYRESDLALLLEESGWQVLRLYRSPFGNIKAVAGRRS